MDDQTQPHYMIRVYEDGEFSYDVGSFRDADSTLGWLYRQVGILKSHHPNEPLKKIRWRYQTDVGAFEDPVVDVKVELAGYGFEVFPLRPPAYTSVVKELMDPAPLPSWAESD